MTKTSEFYRDAFLDGKDAAHAELGTWELGDHAATCDCQICHTVRVIVEKVLLAPQKPVLLPDHHIEGCAKPCGKPCPCWCHAGG